MEMRYLILCSILFVLSSQPAQAFDMPRQECLVPAKPKGGMDLSCRLVANSMLAANLIDEPMKINFKPGGVGAVAYNHVVGNRNADPGLIVAASSGSALNLATRKFGRYDVNAVRWLASLGADYGVVAVRKDAPWNSLQELLDDWVRDPQGLTIGGSGSVGSQDWMKTALITRRSGIDPRKIRYVAFEGGGEAAMALLNGYIQVFPGDAGELHAFLSAGEVKVLAVLSGKRLPGLFAHIPTAREQGYPIEWTIWRGYYMGPEVSDEAYTWWVNTFKRLIKTEEFQQERKRLGLYPFELIGRDFSTFVKASVSQQAQLAREIGLIK